MKARQAQARCCNCAGEGEYSLQYGEVGTRVAIVSSEPITGSSDWVSVPRNTALIISQGKSGYVSILKSPLCGSGKHARQEEVLRCLEAVTSAAEVEGQAYPLHRHKRRRMTQSVSKHLRTAHCAPSLHQSPDLCSCGGPRMA